MATKRVSARSFADASARRVRVTKRGGWRPWAMAVGALFVSSCGTIDTTRIAPPKATLGDDIYGMLCDRVGASSFSEDLTGASYHAICHFDEDGVYGDDVDTAVLPPASGDAVAARQLSIAKLQRMAARRAELIRAFNAALPDIRIPDPTTEDPADTIRLHDALLTFSQDITALYDDNPFDAAAQPPMPMATDAIGRLFGALENSESARASLSRMSGRRGYRPAAVGLGGIRTLLSYPQMRPFVKAQMNALAAGGSANPQLQEVLRVVKREMASSRAELAPLVPLSVDAATAQPNRPRYALEALQELMLDEHPDYAGAGALPQFVTRRDRRGFAIPNGNSPGVVGTVAAPFADIDSNGFADVDGFGRFLGLDGNPLAVDTPFLIPGEAIRPTDEFGRSQAGLYQYLDTSQTALYAVARDTVPLMDASVAAGADDPAPWLTEHETLMYAFAGVRVLGGSREEALYDHYTEQVLAAGAPCPAPPAEVAPDNAVPCSSYQRFVAEQSALPELAHAAGQLIAHPDSDVILLGLLELIENHQDMMARVLGATLKIKAIADEHDRLAAQGVEPKAELAYEVPVWDEMAQVLDRMSQRPGLIADLLRGMANPSLVQTHQQHPSITGAPSQHMGETLSAFMLNRDRFTYDRNDINGPSVNATDGYPSFANPHNPVDRSQPLTGDNRSMFERAAQLIYDGNGARACNKQDAEVYTGILGTYWPLIGSGYDECELFTFQNVGAYYLNSQLPSTHPKRSELEIKPGTLNTLMSTLGIFTSQDAFLESASGIDGMTLHPTPQALNRLMFFGASSEQYGQLPDYDAQNSDTNTAKFIGASIEPLGGVTCPVNNNSVPHCADNEPQEVLRMRDQDVIFGWERLGFFQYLRPQLRVFAELGCNAQVTACDTSDFTGETFFMDLVSTLWKHWPDADHGNYCSSSLPKNDPSYCSEAGISHYEPILGEALAGDIIPAMHEFAKVASTVNITIQRGPKAGQVVNGADIVELLVKIMFDQTWAQSVGLKDRAGNSAASWVDGTPQAQLTMFNLFADGLRKMDQSFEASAIPDAAERRSKWRRARSLLVDQFLTIDGEQGAATFANKAMPRMLAKGLRLMREQVNANCPDRETSGQCVWASQQLGQKLNDAMSRPVFATAVDLIDALSADEPARREMQRFVSYAMANTSESDALFGLLASIADMMPLMQADNDFAPILQAAAVAASPADDPAGSGSADSMLQVLKAMGEPRYDRYHVLDYVLPALVSPIDDGQGLTAIEVAADAIADINRVDAAQNTPLQPQDYFFIMQTLREFMTSDTRGFRQLYYIVDNRPKE